jgi:phosphoglycolate phosphatase-like HAD superfamily hydrolase
MARAQAAPDATVLVGDSLVDWRTAQHASTRVCLARYGFGFDGFPVERIGPDDLVVDRPDELLSVL